MSNFMGPMAPPPAAPAQPQALDFQTDPNQRQRFKQFMQQRMQPPMPQMPAPMPQPMPTVPAGSYILPDMDIFAPQQFYDGGIVGGLNNLGEMSGQMVEALNQVVYGGDPMGGGMPSAPSGPPSMGGGGFGGGNMPPPLPPVDTSVYQPGGSTYSSGPVANIGSGVPTAQPYNHVDASAINTSDMYGGFPGANNSMTMGTGLAADGDVRSAYEAAVKSAQEQRKNGFLGRVVLPGEMGFDQFAEGYNYRLNNPNLQPLTSVGNDGFGSFTQGPLDFLDGSNIAQPTNLPQIDQGFYDSQEYNAFNSGPKMGTADVAFSRYFGQQPSGSISGRQDQAYEEYLRRTGQANKIITTNPYSNLMGVLPNGGVSSGQQSPQDLLRQAQSRMMQQDKKSPELQAYLDNVIQTGGNPTIPEPQTNYLSLGTLPVSSMPPGFTPLPPGELGFTENMIDPFPDLFPDQRPQPLSYGFESNIEEMPYPEWEGGISPVDAYLKGSEGVSKFAQGGSVSDALADALSNDIGDYSFDDTFTDLSQTSYNDFDPGGNESFDAAAMDQFRNQQVSDLSSTLGQQIQNVINSNQQMGTPAPVPQSRIEQMQFENLQNVPTTEPVFSMPSLNLGGRRASFDLLGNPLTIGFEDGGSVPPRETDIRGMHHELSYITPDEADILMALGGTGEAGPMGIPSYRPGGDDVGSENAGSGDHSGGEGSASGANSGGGGGNQGDDNNDGGWDPSDYVGYTEEDEQQQTVDMGNYENDFGGDSPDGYSVQDILNDNAEKAAIERAIATTNAINTANQQNFNNLDQRLAQTQLDPMGTLAKNEILDFEAGPVIGNIETNSIGGVNTGVSKGVSSTNNLLGGIDDLLGSLDKTISKVSGPTQSEINALENARNQAGTFAPTSATASTPTVVGSSDPETYDPDLDQATKNALSNIGVDQSVIDKISRGSSQSGLESEGILGSLGIGSGAAYTGGVNNRFGTATGPGRLSTVTAEEMEALRTGNAVQRQMYRQLAGIKSAGPVLSSFDPNNVKDPNILDSIFGVTNKPSSAIEVFRAPITEQQGFKSVNTGTFKDGIAGVTGEGNTPGFMGGIMQMFGIDPIVYTGDNRFDPNRPPEDFGGGGDDNILLPLKPEEVAPESTDPNQIGGINTPADPLAPAGPVLVPSTRTSTPFSGQMPVGYGSPQTGQINPYALSEMQRYEQFLRQLGQQKSPIGLAQGGSVLDAAAGRFLESLTAA